MGFLLECQILITWKEDLSVQLVDRDEGKERRNLSGLVAFSSE